MQFIRMVNYYPGTQLTIVLIGILALFWRVDLEKILVTASDLGL